MAISRFYNPETLSYQDDPYVKSSGRSSNNLNPAQNQIASNLIGAGTNIAATGVQAGFQTNSIRNARNENREIAERNKTNQLNQQRTEFSFKKQIQEQDIKNFELTKIQEKETLRHSTWLNDLKKAIENDQKLNEIANNIFSTSNRSEDIKNIILSNFRRKK
jgi:hypothetical protein